MEALMEGVSIDGNLIDFLGDYINALEDFLGVKFQMSANKNQKEIDFETLNIDEEVFQVNKAPLTEIFRTIESSMIDFYKEYKDIHFKPLFKSILIEECVYNLIGQKNKSKLQLGAFIEELKQASSKTYESKCTEMSFIVMKDSINIEQYLNSLQIRFIPLNESEKCILEVIQDKQTLKLIDSLSLSYVVDPSFKIIGLAQKIKDKKSIADIMMNRYRTSEQSYLKYNSYEYFIEEIKESESEGKKFTRLTNLMSKLKEEITNRYNEEFKVNYSFQTILRKIINNPNAEQNKGLLKLTALYILVSNKYNKEMHAEELKVNFLEEIATSIDKSQLEDHNGVDFVFIKDKQIYWSLNDSNILNYKNGHWKIKNYTLFSNVLSYFIIKQYFTNIPNMESEIDYILKKMNNSIPKVMDLFNIIKSLSQKNIGSLICILSKGTKRKTTIYKEMLRDGNLTTGAYDVVIKTEKNSPVNIRSCDKYLFELIASIDGAVLLDHSFNILSYGEIIKTTSERSKGIQRGARTTAAISGSKFGLAIKVSEDGDITVYKNNELLMCI